MGGEQDKSKSTTDWLNPVFSRDEPELALGFCDALDVAGRTRARLSWTSLACNWLDAELGSRLELVAERLLIQEDVRVVGPVVPGVLVLSRRKSAEQR